MPSITCRFCATRVEAPTRSRMTRMLENHMRQEHPEKMPNG
jgi:hypothetical protein